jgi:CRP-like cAMP-binding protein/small-conductance mechanosensitive channel
LPEVLSLYPDIGLQALWVFDSFYGFNIWIYSKSIANNMHTHEPKKSFLTTKDIVQVVILFALNAGIAYWLNHDYSTIWAWEAIKLSTSADFGAEELIAFAQLFVFGLTIDRILKIIITDINRTNSKIYIPKILTQVSSILIFGFIGLLGAVKLYELPIRSLLAASGLISVILAYAFRELISDILASAQIQMNRIARIGDWVGLKHNDEAILAKVIDLDQQIVTLQDSSHITRLIRNSQFLQQTIVNYTGHGNIAVRQAEIELSSRLPHTEIIPILENALEFVLYSNHQFHGDCYARTKTLSEGNVKFILEYRCHPSISYGASHHLAINAALRFLKCAGFDLTPPQSQTRSDFENPTRVEHRLLQAKEFGVLKSLNVEETQELEEKISFIILSPLEPLLLQGELKDFIYLVAEGKLSIELPGENGAKAIELAKVWPGDVIGEMSLLTGEKHTANVIAQSRVTLMAIAKADIEPILKKNPQLTQDIVDQVLQLKLANEKKLHHKVDQTERKNLLKRVFQFLRI